MPSDSSRPSSSFEGDFGTGEVLIGRYRIVAMIGEGGMGQVYLADDLVLGQPVAVKILPPHMAQDEGGLERFREEVRHAREVTHPNVARVHDIGEVDGRHFLTPEGACDIRGPRDVGLSDGRRGELVVRGGDHDYPSPRRTMNSTARFMFTGTSRVSG